MAEERNARLRCACNLCPIERIIGAGDPVLRLPRHLVTPGDVLHGPQPRLAFVSQRDSLAETPIPAYASYWEYGPSSLSQPRFVGLQPSERALSLHLDLSLCVYSAIYR